MSTDTTAPVRRTPEEHLEQLARAREAGRTAARLRKIHRLLELVPPITEAQRAALRGAVESIPDRAAS